jgi:hypothetical protein
LCPKFYIIHSNIPLAHSQINPTESKIKTLINKANSLKEATSGSLLIRGNKTTSSTSKITKIRQIKKNWIENKDRWLPLEEKPHSKGLSFSDPTSAFLEKTDPANPTIRLNTKETNKHLANK